ncbi:MAG: Na+/H+ antiporter subunit E [Clostridia bacterium]|nr:Na+/H+ antiporter subunit E [Clostridia bacterium]MBQ4619555.1 Na+/H+ antiporter subunit E [Clostridia bacterium]
MAILLFVFWIMLNGRLEADVLISGAVSALAIWGFMICFTGWSIKKEKQALILFPSVIAYFVRLFIEIFKANIGVLKIIVNGKTDPYIRTIQTPLKTRMARVLLANSITLTPGTVTIQLDGDKLTVHCLTREMAEGLSDFILEKKLIEMEEKANGKRV